MRVIETWREMQKQAQQWQCAGETIGFVPTMGALHQGHLSLAKQASKECEHVGASIFVNPLQFGPQEDLERYPRSFERDCELLASAGCSLVFAPTVEEMYGHVDMAHGTLTYVEVTQLGEMWEGVVRPGHPNHNKFVYVKMLAPRFRAPRNFQMGNYYSSIDQAVLNNNPKIVRNPFH